MHTVSGQAKVKQSLVKQDSKKPAKSSPAALSCSPGENSAPGYSGMDASLSPISYENFSIFWFCFFQDQQMHSKLRVLLTEKKSFFRLTY